VKRNKIIIITGYSGSGKSTAVDALEDAGYYCVDNMPVRLLPKFLELPVNHASHVAGLAFVMDVRGKAFLQEYDQILRNLAKRGHDVQILFLEADENALVARYSQTRRHHPLSHLNGSLIECIRIEKRQLEKLRQSSNRRIDTTHLNVHELKSIIFDLAEKKRRQPVMRICVMSFGFKYGLPANADMVIDVRFIDNPYFIAELKDGDGLRADVRDFVLSQAETQIFLQKYQDLINYLIPLYEKEGKAYLTMAVGCTGGKHRSVAIAKHISAAVNSAGRHIAVVHRDIDRPDSPI